MTGSGRLLAVVGVLLVAAGTARLRRPVRVDILPARSANFRVRINDANVAELGLLPGIGPELAQRIVVDRQAHGRFANATELRRVRGLGTVTVARIEPFIEFDPARAK